MKPVTIYQCHPLNRHSLRNNWAFVTTEAPADVLEQLRSLFACIRVCRHPLQKPETGSTFDGVEFKEGPVLKLTFSGPGGCGKSSIRREFEGVLRNEGFEAEYEEIELPGERIPAPY